MSFKIAIASGKGGTGKTTVSVSLFHFFQKYTTHKIHLVDCDVEEPNAALFFNTKKRNLSTEAVQLVPEINLGKCNYCGKCSEFCEFNAINVIAKIKYIEVNADLCHSCGACLHACSFNAIYEKPVTIGKINQYQTNENSPLSEGILRVGSPMQTMLIKQVKREAATKHDIIIYDAPPGTSCPVVQTIADTDYVILVTEPTPFGLHDLQLTVALLKELNISFGVVINKAGLGNNQLYDYLNKEGIEQLGSIPFSKKFAKQYAKGTITSDNFPEAQRCYAEIIKKLEKRRIEA